MKTAKEESKKRYATVRSEPSFRDGRREQSCSIEVGWTARKNPATGEVFFS